MRVKVYKSVSRRVTRSLGDGRGRMVPEGPVTRSRAAPGPRPGRRRGPSPGRKRTQPTGGKPSPYPSTVEAAKKIAIAEIGTNHEDREDLVGDGRQGKGELDLSPFLSDVNSGQNDVGTSNVIQINDAEDASESDRTLGTSPWKGIPIFLVAPALPPAALGHLIPGVQEVPTPSSCSQPVPLELPLAWPLEEHLSSDLGDVDWVSLYDRWSLGDEKKEGQAEDVPLHQVKSQGQNADEHNHEMVSPLARNPPVPSRFTRQNGSGPQEPAQSGSGTQQSGSGPTTTAAPISSPPPPPNGSLPTPTPGGSCGQGGPLTKEPSSEMASFVASLEKDFLKESKRKRQVSTEKRRALVQAFRENIYVGDRVDRLAELLQLTPKQVLAFFTDRRRSYFTYLRDAGKEALLQKEVEYWADQLADRGQTKRMEIGKLRRKARLSSNKPLPEDLSSSNSSQQFWNNDPAFDTNTNPGYRVTETNVNPNISVTNPRDCPNNYHYQTSGVLNPTQGAHQQYMDTNLNMWNRAEQVGSYGESNHIYQQHLFNDTDLNRTLNSINSQVNQNTNPWICNSGYQDQCSGPRPGPSHPQGHSVSGHRVDLNSYGQPMNQEQGYLQQHQTPNYPIQNWSGTNNFDYGYPDQQTNYHSQAWNYGSTDYNWNQTYQSTDWAQGQQNAINQDYNQSASEDSQNFRSCQESGGTMYSLLNLHPILQVQDLELCEPSGQGQGQSQGQGQDQSQGEGQGQDQSQGEGQGQDQSQSGGQGQSLVEGQGQSQGLGQGPSQDQGQDQSQDQGQDQSQDQGQGQTQGQSQRQIQGQCGHTGPSSLDVTGEIEPPPAGPDCGDLSGTLACAASALYSPVSTLTPTLKAALEAPLGVNLEDTLEVAGPGLTPTSPGSDLPPGDPPRSPSSPYLPPEDDIELFTGVD